MQNGINKEIGSVSVKSLTLVKDYKDKAKWLGLVMGDSITYLEEYNNSTFKRIARRYGVLLTKKNECIVITNTYPSMFPYAKLKKGQEWCRDSFADYYANKYETKPIDTDKPLYLNRLSSRVEVDRKYYVLEDRAELGVRELTKEEKEDINEYFAWYKKQIRNYASRYYNTHKEIVLFDEADEPVILD